MLGPGFGLPLLKGSQLFQPQALPAPCSKRCSFVWRIAHWKIHMVHLSWRFCESDHTQNKKQKKHEAVIICPPSLTWNLKSVSLENEIPFGSHHLQVPCQNFRGVSCNRALPTEAMLLRNFGRKLSFSR